MKERPILFSAPMVLALLAGTKTQTRRIVKPQPTRTLPNTKTVGDLDIVHAQGWRWQKSKSWSAYAADSAGPDAFAKTLANFSPYGVPGDRLWVRETWRTVEREEDGVDGVRLFADDAFQPIPNDPFAAGLWVDDHQNGRHGDDWRPSIFMKRWASRLTLEVTEVRVQRLQGISEEDAKAEGVEPLKHVGADQPFEDGSERTQGTYPHTLAFAVLWDKINGKRAPWASNPWIWCVSFRRVP